MRSIQAALLTAAVLGGGLSLAQDDSDDQIKYRQAVMKSLGGHFAATSLIMRDKVDFRPHLIDHARALANASINIHAIFPQSSELGETEAMAEIWEKPEEFQLKLAAAEQAADNFLRAVEADDQQQMQSTFRELGQSCKGCHDEFRMKKE
ncbi:MAG: cytochrome c [Candidatus Competibacteraceae bacterium]|nr:cytochrome c [Candidatus Competibacteraceae bacterium]